MEFKDAHIRNFLRVLAAIVLVAWVFFVIADKARNGKVYLDVNDGLVIGGCVGILLAIEAVRAYVKRKFDKNQ